MKEEGLLITCYRTSVSSMFHTGRIAVENPNTRWACVSLQLNVGIEKSSGWPFCGTAVTGQ
jgi:hypothetical protein